MRVKVLGSAAGGGFPQWNCQCPNCSALRHGKLQARARTQTQVIFSPDSKVWFLLCASPDLRQQVLAAPELAPPADRPSPPIGGEGLSAGGASSGAARTCWRRSGEAHSRNQTLESGE